MTLISLRSCNVVKKPQKFSSEVLQELQKIKRLETM